jgi:xylulokinase
MAKEGYLAAIDVGSTTTRCILFDLAGRPAGEGYREPPVHHPQANWSEVDPEDWWAAAKAVSREALQQAGVPAREVLAVGLTGLKHAPVLVDAEGRPLARAMLWMDQRCRPQAEWMARELGDLIKESVGGGGTVTTTPSAPKLRWIVEHDPDLLRRTAALLLPKDYVRFKLTGTIGTDPSDAGGTRLYDGRRGDWATPLVERIGVPPGILPPIYPSTHVAGGVTPGAAEATGLAPGTPVVVGGGDVRSTLTGANAYHTGRACLYLGTSAWMSVPPPAQSAHGAPGRSLAAETFGATSTTGAALRWLKELLAPSPGPPPGEGTSASYAALLQEAERAPLGARGLILLPHLMGERGPRYDPYARGVLYGLTLAHRRGDLARALLEGCAFQLRRIAESLPGERREEMVAVGGGARGALWLQILADVMDVPLLVPRVLEAGALGAAIVAGVGIGVYGSAQQAAGELVEIVHRVCPDPARHGRYDEIYASFLELEERVAPLYESAPEA